MRNRVSFEGTPNVERYLDWAKANLSNTLAVISYRYHLGEND
jgi:hypothetical protein